MEEIDVVTPATAGIEPHRSTPHLTLFAHTSFTTTAHPITTYTSTEPPTNAIENNLENTQTTTITTTKTATLHQLNHLKSPRTHHCSTRAS